jgi:hypothetical protein
MPHFTFLSQYYILIFWASQCTAPPLTTSKYASTKYPYPKERLSTRPDRVTPEICTEVVLIDTPLYKENLEDPQGQGV